MKYKYITIEREYGSGGTHIARLLSEKTKVPCYGHEILEEVSKKYGIPVEKIESYEETATNSFLYSVYMLAKASSASNEMLTEEGHIYVAEQAVIKQLASDGTSIFLGHCASEALKDKDGVINVFIRCSDNAIKRARIAEDYGIPEAKIETTCRRFDKKRANYYYVNTAKKWDDFRNYDIVLDSSVLGIDGCAAMLGSLFSNL